MRFALLTAAVLILAPAVSHAVKDDCGSVCNCYTDGTCNCNGSEGTVGSDGRCDHLKPAGNVTLGGTKTKDKRKLILPAKPSPKKKIH